MSSDLPRFRCLAADARSPKLASRLLGEERAAVLLTDPPYCLLTRRRKGGDEREPRGRKLDHEIVVRFDDVKGYRKFTEAWLPEALSRVRSDGVAVLWTNFLGAQPMKDVARACGFGVDLGEFVWAKRTTERQGNEQLLRVYEVALLLGRAPRPALLPTDASPSRSVVAGYDDDGEADATGRHPHHKPFSVIEPLVREFSKPGDWVLDPFAGSGSIPAAALRLGRNTACCELEEPWARKVAERLATHGRELR